jgi:hypothetical protein
MSLARVGVHARNASIGDADKQAIKSGRIEAAKLLVGGNDLSDIDEYRQAGVKTFHARLYTQEPAHEGGMSAAKFVQVFTPAIHEYLAKGISAFEVHNEPNLTTEGYNVTWHSPQEFAAWFVQIVQGLRARFGRSIRLGFPGLSPGGAGGERVVSDWDFLAGCKDAVAVGDFLCVHTYWQSRTELEDINGGLRFLKEYHEKFPDKTIVISEFSNNGGQDAAEKARQYPVFYTLCAQYPWLEAALVHPQQSQQYFWQRGVAEGRWHDFSDCTSSRRADGHAFAFAAANGLAGRSAVRWTDHTSLWRAAAVLL